MLLFATGRMLLFVTVRVLLFVTAHIFRVKMNLIKISYSTIAVSFCLVVCIYYLRVFLVLVLSA